MQSVFQFLPKMFSRPKVRALKHLSRPLKFFLFLMWSLRRLNESGKTTFYFGTGWLSGYSGIKTLGNIIQHNSSSQFRVIKELRYAD